MKMKQHKRKGSTLVETAFVYPIVFMLVMAAVIIGLGVFRYQQMSHLARESSRWASVRGDKYAKENKTTAATPDDIYNNVIVPNMAGLKTSEITYTVTWPLDSSGNPDKRQTKTVTYIDSATGLTKYKEVSNTVSVTVSYQWDTILFGTYQVTSTSVNTISY